MHSFNHHIISIHMIIWLAGWVVNELLMIVRASDFERLFYLFENERATFYLFVGARTHISPLLPPSQILTLEEDY